MKLTPGILRARFSSKNRLKEQALDAKLFEENSQPQAVINNYCTQQEEKIEVVDWLRQSLSKEQCDKSGQAWPICKNT